MNRTAILVCLLGAAVQAIELKQEPALQRQAVETMLAQTNTDAEACIDVEAEAEHKCHCHDHGEDGCGPACISLPSPCSKVLKKKPLCYCNDGWLKSEWCHHVDIDDKSCHHHHCKKGCKSCKKDSKPCGRKTSGKSSGKGAGYDDHDEDGYGGNDNSGYGDENYSKPSYNTPTGPSYHTPAAPGGRYSPPTSGSRYAPAKPSIGGY